MINRPEDPTLVVEAAEVGFCRKGGKYDSSLHFDCGVAEISFNTSRETSDGGFAPSLSFHVYNSADNDVPVDERTAISFDIWGRRSLVMLRAYIDMVLSEVKR